MLQVAISGGEVRVVEVPEPVVRRGAVLVRTSHSLISAGTESAGIGSGGRRENIVLRAIRNPALVKKVVDRVASHGLASTAELVRTRISTEMATGYSCAGVVVDVGEDVTDILLNLKQLVCILHGESPEVEVRLTKRGEGVVTAADIEAPADLEILNPDLEIANLSSKGRLEITLTIGRGRGYVPSEGNRGTAHTIGVIPVDSMFSPITRVSRGVGVRRDARPAWFARASAGARSSGRPARASFRSSGFARGV